MKNVLFLAPDREYAKTVVVNLRRDLTRNGIRYAENDWTGCARIKTAYVQADIIYKDPVKWTDELFRYRDAVFGCEPLVAAAADKYFHFGCKAPRIPLITYILGESNRINSVPVDDKKTYLPEVSKVYFNNPVTVVLWADGTKTIVECQEGDVYSKETGLALCYMKKALGNMPNFNNAFRKWIPAGEEGESVPTSPLKKLTVNVNFNTERFQEVLDEAIETITNSVKECVSHV